MLKRNRPSLTRLFLYFISETTTRSVTAALSAANGLHTLGNLAVWVEDPRGCPRAKLNSYRSLCGTRSDNGRASNLLNKRIIREKFHRANRRRKGHPIVEIGMSYVPGLSARNRNTTYPLLGTAIVSLEGGRLNSLCKSPRLSRSRACLRLIFLTFLSGDLPIPITLKAYPCKWNGCERLGCCTERD